jgi:hypothetical protein
MITDYTSAAPFNDPLNPWPVYSQLQVTSVGDSSEQTCLYNLSVFEPLNPYLNTINTSPPESFSIYMTYVKEGSNSLLNAIFFCLSANTLGYGVLQNVWIWQDVLTAGYGAHKIAARNNLFKPVSGGLDGWTTMTGNVSASTISAVLSSKLGFEKRRVALGSA